MQIKYFVLMIPGLFFPASYLQADIATDGTVGLAKQLMGPNFTIPQQLGTTKGNNLFHSFEKFSIQQGQSAHFTGNSAIQNVISRVTGKDISTINGTLSPVLVALN